MGKLMRERERAEKRARKQEKKEQRKLAAKGELVTEGEGEESVVATETESPA